MLTNANNSTTICNNANAGTSKDNETSNTKKI